MVVLSVDSVDSDDTKLLGGGGRISVECGDVSTGGGEEATDGGSGPGAEDAT